MSGAPYENRRSIDARAWLIWTGAAALLTMLGRNPLYIIILLLAARLVGNVWQQPGEGFPLPLRRLALLVLAFSTLFNLLFVHVGGTVLWRLPGHWPLVGGPGTAEAAVYGLTNGLMLLTLLIIFITFNRIITASDLVQLTPRAFHNLGLVLLIALTYVPETRRHWDKIRAAQAIRGQTLQGWRDWRAVLLPLLVGGMERALALAEAMVARGYGATAPTAQPALVQGLLLLGLGGAFAGWLLTFWVGWPGWVLLGSGVITLLLLVWGLGQRAPLRRYQKRQWGWREMVVVTTAVCPLLILPLTPGGLTYTPYPQLSPPPFQPAVGLLLLLLAVPGGLPRD